MSEKKILSLDELSGLLAERRSRGEKVVLCHGVFDLMHLGHIRHFEVARGYGDLLVVTITPDKYVNKGPHRPVFNEDLRAEAIAALELVDFVAINRWRTAVETLELLQPDFYVKGSDYKDAADDITGEIRNEEDVINKIGGKLVFTNEISFSSSRLINEQMGLLPERSREYLSEFSKRHSADDILASIDTLSKLRILIVGEAIIDEYVYGVTIGKSSKEPHLVVRRQRSERYVGGALAIANHVAGFCDEVTVITYLGDRDSHEDFIRAQLLPNVTPVFIYKKDSPTIFKQRVIDEYFFHKLIEFYDINDEPLDKEQEAELTQCFAENVSGKDLVMVADYGHGFVGGEAIEKISGSSPFLALNVQCNSGNFGYNFVSKYPRANLITIDESELRLENRSRGATITELLESLSGKVETAQIIVTRGSYGSSSYVVGERHLHVPAFAGKVVDRVGAGDAFFAVSSMLAASGADPEEVGFVGNVVGAIAVTIVGNREPVTKVALKKSIESLLK